MYDEWMIAVDIQHWDGMYDEWIIAVDIQHYDGMYDEWMIAVDIQHWDSMYDEWMMAVDIQHWDGMYDEGMIAVDIQHWDGIHNLDTLILSKVHAANMGPIWGRKDPGGSLLAPWTLLSGYFKEKDLYIIQSKHHGFQTRDSKQQCMSSCGVDLYQEYLSTQYRILIPVSEVLM